MNDYTSTQDSARTVQSIYGAFKGKKFSRDALQSIHEPIREYYILICRISLPSGFKSKFFICIFDDAKISHFISNCSEDMDFDKMY